ncbi:class II glutamine amidotransferase [Pseudomonadota bacterium]|jgi:glutamine amidotransferase
MCRFIAYLGKPIMADELLLKPTNSLVHQSYSAGEMPEILNGDGFGVGWYAHSISERPGLFRAITPAWSNRNLHYNAPLIRTNCLFAHIRAATVGATTEDNTHPFSFERFLMMHNGSIPQFHRIRRKLLALLDDEIFLWIKGQTDSEHVFALLMQHIVEMRGAGARLTEDQIQQCFQKTFDVIQQLKVEAGIGEDVSNFNLMVTNGRRIFGTRYSSNPDKETRTLYYATGSEFECRDGVCQMIRDGSNHESVLIVSEKLTEKENEWNVIPPNHFIAIDRDLQVHLSPMRC